MSHFLIRLLNGLKIEPCLILQNPSRYIYNLKSNSSATSLCLDIKPCLRLDLPPGPCHNWLTDDQILWVTIRIDIAVFSRIAFLLLHLVEISSGRYLDVRNVGIAYKTSWRIGLPQRWSPRGQEAFCSPGQLEILKSKSLSWMMKVCYTLLELWVLQFIFRLAFPSGWGQNIDLGAWTPQFWTRSMDHLSGPGPWTPCNRVHGPLIWTMSMDPL